VLEHRFECGSAKKYAEMRYFALGRCGKASSLKRYIKKFGFKRWNMCAVPHVFCGHWHQRRIHELSRSTPEPITMREASVLWAAKREAAKETA
jgi:hypothetical protein